MACTEKRRRICRQESDGDGGAGEKKEEGQSGGGWIAPGTTCQRENCQGRTRKTGLNPKTHRPHIKVGKDEEKKKECSR